MTRLGSSGCCREKILLGQGLNTNQQSLRNGKRGRGGNFIQIPVWCLLNFEPRECIPCSTEHKLKDTSVDCAFVCCSATLMTGKACGFGFGEDVCVGGLVCLTRLWDNQTELKT